MISKTKLAFAAAVVAASIATPALAQTYGGDRGSYDHQVVREQRNSDSPAATGGGSIGYNQQLEQY